MSLPGRLTTLSLGCRLLAAVALTACEPPPLSVTPLGCAPLHRNPDAEPSCDLPPSRVLRLLAACPPAATLTIKGNHGQPTITELQRSGDERVVRVEVPAGTTQLTIKAASRWSRGRELQLAVQDADVHAAPWLLQARALFEEKNQPKDAEELLRAHLGSTGPPELRAQALGMLADIARESNRSDTLALLDQAIDAAAAAHLPSAVAELTLRKTWVLCHHLQRCADAEALLQVEPLFAQSPENRTWALSQRALLRREQGDLAGAVELLVQAESWAYRIVDDVARLEVTNQRATTLVMMGRVAEAEKLYAALAGDAADPCRRGQQLATQGYAWSLARRALRNDAARLAKLEPRPLLAQSAQMLAACRIPYALAHVLTNLAHLAAGDGDYAQVQELLAKARATMPQPDPNLQLEWLDLDGQVALSQRKFPEADKKYAELAGLSAGKGYEPVWLALVGRARAQQESAPQEAQALYARAEAYLDERSLELPLGAGRGTFLGRFELGTAYYLELLVRTGALPAAVQLVRHARARGLWALSQLGRASAMSPAQRREWDAALADFRRARQQLDELTAAAGWDAELPAKALLAEQPQRQQQLHALLDDALRRLGSAPAQQEFRPPQADELMLTCHPGSGAAWHCFAWDRQGIRHFSLARMDAAQLAAGLSGIREKLTAARRLTVIGYGGMRAIDLHLLPWPGAKRSLDEKLAVVYALDLPWLKPPPSQSANKALLIFDPQGQLPRLRRAAEPIGRALRAQGFTLVSLPAGAVRIGEYAGRPLAQPTAAVDSLPELLNQVTLFLYGGHGDYEPVGGWGHKLRTADGAGLLVDDILMLERGPQKVLLLGCNTGQSAEEVGGIEGLGLAQAFLIRGSAWTIATVRPVSDPVAAELAVAMVTSGKGLAGASSVTSAADEPAALLEAARRTVLAKLGSDAARQELGAFRVFVP